MQQVVTITMNADTAANTYQLILTDELGVTGNASFTSTGGGTTANATGLAAAINASTDARFRGVVSATSNSNVVTVTASRSGVPFYPSLGGTGSAQMTLATATANSGPNDFNVAANWAEKTVAVGGDDVTVTGSNAIYYGVKTGLTFAAFLAAPGCSAPLGQQGVPFSFSCTSFSWYSTGVSWVDINASAISVNVYATASANDPQCGLNLYGSAIATLFNWGGSVGLCMTAGSTSTVATISHLGPNAGNARTRARTGLTLTTLQADDGTVYLDVAATTLSMNGGTLVTGGSGAYTTVNNNGCSMVLNSSGIITTLNNNSGTTDFTKSLTARTVTTANLAGGSISYDPSVVTLTNKINPNGVGPQKVTAEAA